MGRITRVKTRHFWAHREIVYKHFLWWRRVVMVYTYRTEERFNGLTPATNTLDHDRFGMRPIYKTVRVAEDKRYYVKRFRKGCNL